MKRRLREWAEFTDRVEWGAKNLFECIFQEFEFQIKGFKYFKMKFELGSNWDKFK
jgi:hypothetical protein